MRCRPKLKPQKPHFYTSQRSVIKKKNGLKHMLLCVCCRCPYWMHFLLLRQIQNAFVRIGSNCTSGTKVSKNLDSYSLSVLSFLKFSSLVGARIVSTRGKSWYLTCQKYIKITPTQIYNLFFCKLICIHFYIKEKIVQAYELFEQCLS